MSFYERDPLLKSSDWVAPRLLPTRLQPLVRIPLTRRLLRAVISPQGVYGWVIARTRYIDEALLLACKEGFSQVLLLGAGFDSRGVRFSSELSGMRVFELDAPATQALKIAQFRLRGVTIPPNVVLVGLDLERETLERTLEHCKFEVGRKTLAILEGVLQYLNPRAVGVTFATLRDILGTGSRVVFDHAYASVVRGEGRVYGQARMVRGVNRFGESWQFGLDDADVQPFLEGYGFMVIDRKSPKELEELNFRGADGRIRARVNGTQGIVTAARR